MEQQDEKDFEKISNYLRNREKDKKSDEFYEVCRIAFRFLLGLKYPDGFNFEINVNKDGPTDTNFI